MNIALASSFPLGKEGEASARVSYEFQLNDPGKEIPLYYFGSLALEEFFPPELKNMVNLGQGLPVQVSRLGPKSKNWRQPRPVTESFNIAAFEPQKLLEILRPGDEAIIGLAVQATVNGQTVNDGKPMEKNLLVHRGSDGSSLNTIKIAEVETPKDALDGINIFNVIGRTSGVIHPKSAYSPSEYFGWPTNAWRRNRRGDDNTLQIRHLVDDLFLGDKLVLEPVIEAAVGPAASQQTGEFIGYDLIAIGWQTINGKRQVNSQTLLEFR